MVDENGTTINERAQVDFSTEVQAIACDEVNDKDSEYATFTVVENMPILWGGINELQDKLIYPAKDSGIEGRVTVQFIVDKSGHTQCHEVIKSLGELFDQEAIRVIKEARFTPGSQKGKPVRVQYSLPITFRQ